MQINDCIVSALGSGQINDLLLAYYQAGGAVSNDINDAEYEFLLANGSSAGHVNDMWYELLTSLGYSGSLDDMQYAFWCTDSGVIPVTVPDVVGLTEAAAISAITAAGLIANNAGGTVDPVISQDPTAGSSVPPGSVVNYTLTTP